MSLLNIFNKNKREEKKFFKSIYKRIFPNGDKDIDAGTKECRFIFDNEISYEEAKYLFLKTTLINSTTGITTIDMLREYIQNDIDTNRYNKQINKYYAYLISIKIANITHKAGPLELRRTESGYSW